MLLLYRTVVNVTRLGWSGPYQPVAGLPCAFQRDSNVACTEESLESIAGCRCFAFDRKNGAAFRHWATRLVPISWV